MDSLSAVPYPVHTVAMDHDGAEMDDLDRMIAAEVARDPHFMRGIEGFDRAAEIIDQLVAARTAAGISQAELARRMGTSRAALNRIETHRQDPGLSTISRYAAYIGYQLDAKRLPRAAAAPTRRGVG